MERKPNILEYVVVIIMVIIATISMLLLFKKKRHWKRGKEIGEGYMEKRVVIHPVKDISTSDQVMVIFEDGHRAIFMPYTHGLGYQIEGLQGFRLFDPDKMMVCEYNGRFYRMGPCENEHKLVLLAEGYTQQGVAAYWESAVSHIHNLFWQVDAQEEGENESDHDFWYVWRVTSEGIMFGLTRLKEGKLELLSPSWES